MSNDSQDKLLNCRECGNDFMFSGREQEFYAQKGFDHEPTRCVQCRNQRRRERNVTPSSAGGFNGMRSQPANNNNAPNGNLINNQAGPNSYYNSGNNAGNNQQRSNGGVRPGGINNGYRTNNYGNRQFGPNYSTLGRNNMNSGYSYNSNRPPAYNNGGNGLNGGYYTNNNQNQQAANGVERKMYPIVCARCGVNTEVPFPPREGTPVFCRTCYNSQKNGR